MGIEHDMGHPTRSNHTRERKRRYNSSIHKLRADKHWRRNQMNRCGEEKKKKKRRVEEQCLPEETWAKMNGDHTNQSANEK